MRRVTVRCLPDGCARVRVTVEQHEEWVVPLIERYDEVVDAALGDAPPQIGVPPKFGPDYREIDSWIEPPTSLELMSIGQSGEDFAQLPEDGQRTFLLVGAEALYGPRRDLGLLAECVVEAMEPA